MLIHEYLLTQLRFEPETGLFWWLVPARKRQLNKPAGCQRKDRRWVIRVDGQLYLAHQLAWFWMTGRWVDEIDHENNDPGDNRWGNLREATSSQNKANRRVSSRSRIGVKGVSPHQGGFRARLQKNGRRIDCGVYATIEQAAAAYDRAATEIHGQFARSL